MSFIPDGETFIKNPFNMLPDTHYSVNDFINPSSMLISCTKVIKEANNLIISHDDYLHCSSILSLLTVLSSLYAFSLHSLITPAIILSEERSHFLTVFVSAWNTTPHICMALTERWWLIWYPPSSFAMSSPPTILSWWMASCWNTGSLEGITNVTGFKRMTNGLSL